MPLLQLLQNDKKVRGRSFITRYNVYKGNCKFFMADIREGETLQKTNFVWRGANHRRSRYWATFVMTKTRETYAARSLKRQTALSSLHNAGLFARIPVRNSKLHRTPACTPSSPLPRDCFSRPPSSCARGNPPELVDRRKRTNAPRETGRREAVRRKGNENESGGNKVFQNEQNGIKFVFFIIKLLYYPEIVFLDINFNSSFE